MPKWQQADTETQAQGRITSSSSIKKTYSHALQTKSFFVQLWRKNLKEIHNTVPVYILA